MIELPENAEGYIELVKSLKSRWSENRTVADSIEELHAIDQWYVSTITALVDKFYKSKLKSFTIELEK